MLGFAVRQKVKVQGHGGIKYAGDSTLRSEPYSTRVSCFNFSFSFSQLLVLVTQVSRQNECDHTMQIAFTQLVNHTLKYSDEMSTKTSGILVLVSVIWSNFRHSFSFVDENLRLLVIVFVSMTKINLFPLTKF